MTAISDREKVLDFIGVCEPGTSEQWLAVKCSRVGNGKFVNAIGIGTAVLPVVTPSGSHTVTLSNVYHAPEFGDVSLVSLGQLKERGARYFSSPGGVSVVKCDRVVLYGYSIG